MERLVKQILFEVLFFILPCFVFTNFEKIFLPKIYMGILFNKLIFTKKICWGFSFVKKMVKKLIFRNINQKHEVLICFEALVFLSDCKAIFFQVLLFLFKILIFVKFFSYYGDQRRQKKRQPAKKNWSDRE